jgi:signal transduction histidine kinase/CheY-like chemotaxis protein
MTSTSAPSDTPPPAALRRGLFRLGMAPCVIVTLTLIGWFASSRFATPPAALASQDARASLRLLALDAGIAAIALLAAWAWVRHAAQALARPLRHISRAVETLEAGQFDARCDVAIDHGKAGGQTRHEFAHLAHHINRLAERLQRNQQFNDERMREATAMARQRMAEAEQAALSRARFLAAASHDLRQPLHAMGLFIDALLPTANPAQRTAVRRLRESADFMGMLLDDLLEISRLDAHMPTPVLASVPLADLFDRLEARHAAAAADARVRLVWKDRGLVVTSDAALLLRVVGNLVGNAIRYTPADGTVLVIARRRRGTVRIEVRDNGIGIEPSHQARVFEEFYQVANIERDRRQGFGLGLAICARIALLLGTRIELRSAPQAGSLFWLSLPAACPRPIAAPSGKEPITVAPLAGLRCLVVDADRAILDGSRALLERWGCLVDCAATRKEALGRLGSDTLFDVVLCDLRLAGEDGMEVIQDARYLQPDALPVLISGVTGPEPLQRLRKSGVLLLTKPVAPAKLRALLSTRRAAKLPPPLAGEGGGGGEAASMTGVVSF